MRGVGAHGLCRCGCGQRTAIARWTDSRRGWNKGQPVPWLKGHNAKPTGPEYVVQDCGYRTHCWVWQRDRNEQGYGVQGRARAHRLIYEREIGPIPEGTELDHLCRNTSCVNPAHMEPVTHAGNIRRAKHVKLTVASAAWVKTFIAMGFRTADVARFYGIAPQTVTTSSAGSWADIAPAELPALDVG